MEKMKSRVLVGWGYNVIIVFSWSAGQMYKVVAPTDQNSGFYFFHTSEFQNQFFNHRKYGNFGVFYCFWALQVDFLTKNYFKH